MALIWVRPKNENSPTCCSFSSRRIPRKSFLLRSPPPSSVFVSTAVFILTSITESRILSTPGNTTLISFSIPWISNLAKPGKKSETLGLPIKSTKIDTFSWNWLPAVRARPHPSCQPRASSVSHWAPSRKSARRSYHSVFLQAFSLPVSYEAWRLLLLSISRAKSLRMSRQ